MKIVVSTHQGKLYDEEVDYIVVKNKDGEFALMKNHLPLISVIPLGEIKLVLGKLTLYIAVNNGMLEFKDNFVNVIAQDAFIGRDRESSRAHLDQILKDQLEANRKENVDFTQKEREMIEHMKRAKAGNL
jgi:F-type H+-transporting ATPase subunit epsilon